MPQPQLIDRVLSGRMGTPAPEPPTLPTPSECARSPLITLLVGKDHMAFTVHKKILTSRSPFFRSMLASTPTPVSLNTALNGVIKSTIDAQANPDAMTDVEITTPEAQVKPEVKAEEPRDSKSITPENGATTLILGDDDVISVKCFIDWAYTGTFAMSAEREIFHLTIYNFADKVSEAYCNDFLDSFRAYYFSKSTYMNQVSLKRLYEAGFRNSPLAKFGLKTIVYATMKWPKGWVKDEKKAKRGNSVTVVGGAEEKESLDEWTTLPVLLLDYTDEVIKWQRKAGTDPAAMKGCAFHDHKKGSVCKAAMELK